MQFVMKNFGGLLWEKAIACHSHRAKIGSFKEIMSNVDEHCEPLLTLKNYSESVKFS